ncbi:unnamed protein product [Cuscuta campestris]|uniref:Uncharacterized protein n=1 Tax=Cuscuta campestris TaxID=132261 RepID=A0A484M624_9ASTE|nr:unnamed protein product [Cuscuta campestris]
MDRWSGILKVPLYKGSSTTYYRIAASLRLSPSSNSFPVPAANAIFFNGDRVEGTGNPVIERLSDLQKVAEILVSKFGDSVNAWVIEAPIFNGPFAVYKDFIPSCNDSGEPEVYDAKEFPASSSLVLLLWNCLKEAKIVAAGTRQKQTFIAEDTTQPSQKPRTILLGFSKGGTVLNQLLSELAVSSVQSPEDKGPQANKDEITPTSKERFLNSIAEFHYVDVGLNTKGAYLTNQDVFDKISDRFKRGAPCIRFFLHGTPRQWGDVRRGWIRREKDELVRVLKGVAHRHLGKLYVRERLYFGDMPPDMQMHFEIIEHLDFS